MENEPTLKNSYLKRNAFKTYFELVNKMFTYEKELHRIYSTKATYLVNAVMHKNILTMQISNKETCKLRYHNVINIHYKFLVLILVTYISDSLETLKLRRV